MDKEHEEYLLKFADEIESDYLAAKDYKVQRQKQLKKMRRWGVRSRDLSKKELNQIVLTMVTIDETNKKIREIKP